jgi:hypothetical protein
VLEHVRQREPVCPGLRLMGYLVQVVVKLIGMEGPSGREADGM